MIDWIVFPVVLTYDTDRMSSWDYLANPQLAGLDVPVHCEVSVAVIQSDNGSVVL